MGCGSSTARDIVKTQDLSQLKQSMKTTPAVPVLNVPQMNELYPRQPPSYPVQQLAPAHNNFHQVSQTDKQLILKNNVNILQQQQELSQDILPDNQVYEPIVISEEHLEDYIELEKSIHELEKKKVLQRLHVAVDELQRASIEIAATEETKLKIINELKSKNMGKAEIPSVTAKQLVMEIDAIDEKANKVDAKKKVEEKNHEIKTPSILDDGLQKKKEAIETELEEKRKKYSALENEVTTLNAQAAELLDMYLMQDELICKIFGQGYVNGEEAKLGSHLQCLEDKKERIEMARRKWKEAQLLLEFACKQLAFAIQQWQDLPNVPSINLEVRYSLSEDATKSLKNASDKFGLGDFGNMPYCTQEELAALEAMVASNKSDNIDEKHLTMLDNYSDAHKRALAMLKWFSKVFSTSIHRDLVDVSEEVRVTSQALRKERLHIIRDKLKDKRRFSVDQLSSLDNDDGDNAVRRMLSGCKDGKNCQVIHEHEHKKLPEKERTKEKATVKFEPQKNKQGNENSSNSKITKQKDIASSSISKSNLEGQQPSGNASSSNKNNLEGQQPSGNASSSNKNNLEGQQPSGMASSSNKSKLEGQQPSGMSSSSNKSKLVDQQSSGIASSSHKSKLDGQQPIANATKAK